MRKIFATGFSLLVLLLISVVSADAYNNKITHPRMTEASLDGMDLNGFFAANLGVNDVKNMVFPYSVDGGIKFEYAKKLLMLGSDWEDVPICRASNHFHNPLGA